MIYKISEKTIRLYRLRLFIASFPVFCLFIFFIAISLRRMEAEGQSGIEYVFSFAMTFLILGVIAFFSERRWSKHFRSIRLELHENSFTFSAAGHAQEVLYSTISRLIIYKNPSSLFVESAGKKFSFAGYEDMDEMIEHLTKSVDPHVVKRVKRSINTDDPISVVLLSSGSVLIFGLVVVVGAKIGVYHILDRLFSIGFGFYFILFLPETSPKYLRKIGWALVAFGLIDLCVVAYQEGLSSPREIIDKVESVFRSSPITQNLNEGTVVSNAPSKNRIVQRILNGDFDKPTNIWMGAKQGDLASVKTFLSQGVDVNATNDEGATPLIIAASFGRTEVVKYLVKEGARVDLADEKGNSAIFNAVCHDHRDTIQALVDLGANSNLRNKKGETLLFMAAYYGFDDEFPILLAAGTDPDVKNKEGRTYLEEFKKDFPGQ